MELMALYDLDEQQSVLSGEVQDDCGIPFHDPSTSGEWVLIKCSPLILFELEQFIEMRVDEYNFYRTKKENYHEAIAYMAEQGYTFTKECQCPQVDIAAYVESLDKVQKTFGDFSKKIEKLIEYFSKQYLDIYFSFAAVGAKETHGEKNRCLFFALIQLKDINDYFLKAFRAAFVHAGLKAPECIDDFEF